jgi:hypothetical protein
MTDMLVYGNCSYSTLQWYVLPSSRRFSVKTRQADDISSLEGLHVILLQNHNYDNWQ